MYIHSFRLIAPRKLLEAQLINQRYQNYEDIPTVHDRLRWCRHHKGLTQKEVAELTGISHSRYSDMENGAVDYYTKEIADKLAAFYEIPVYDLLDDYNLFLYTGQGKLIREYRESLGMKIKPFGALVLAMPHTSFSISIYEREFVRYYHATSSVSLLEVGNSCNNTVRKLQNFFRGIILSEEYQRHTECLLSSD